MNDELRVMNDELTCAGVRGTGTGYRYKYRYEKSICAYLGNLVVQGA